MAEFLTSPDDILPACDQCHARKVKCNRRSPCANCADAGVECRRLRRGRSSRKQTSQSRGFNPQETILDLDLETQSPQPQMNSPRTRRWRYQAGSLTQNAPTQSHSSDMDMADGNMDETADLEQPPQDHARNSGQTPLPVTAQPTSGANDSNYHAIQARNIIELELDDCQAIGRERQSILRSALQLVSSVAENEPGHSGSIPENPRSTDPAITIPEAPPRELLFMLLGGPLDAVRTQWPDHIPQKTYERMVTTLLQADQSDEFFPQHSVCIYVKAIFYLYQVTRTTDNPVLKRELSQSKSAYIAAAAQSIQRFNILQRPGLLTVQALLSSALLMQHIGRFNQCWLLTSYAARQITSLNYHKTCHALANSGLELEINCAVYWCYYLDRTLSSLLDRPPSLPEPVVSPTDLIVIESSSAYSGLLHIIIKLAQIQGKLHEISSCRESLPNSVMLTKCQPLEADMQTLLPYLESNRSSFSKMIQCDWVAVDFCYYAIFVEIHRIHLKSCFTPHIYRECLIHARKSLETFHFLQQHSAEMPGFDDPYPSFLTWTLFLYPLSAFFVVFCHIVGTSDTSDFQLLRQITGGLLHFKQDPHLGRLLTLLQSLQRLCEPLFQKQSNNSATGEDSLANVNHSLAHFSGTGGPATESFTFPQSSPPALFRDDMPLVNEPIQNAELDPSAEWQMWQLFTNQAPNGWLNKGVHLFDL